MTRLGKIPSQAGFQPRNLHSRGGPFKGRHGSWNKGSFESSQCKSKVSSNVLEDRESNPFVVTSDTSCNCNSNGTILCVTTLLPQLSGLLTAVCTLNHQTKEGVTDRRDNSTTPITDTLTGGVCLLVGCLTSQQQASVSQGRICLDNFTCCHTEIEVVDQTFYLTQSQYTDTGPTSPSGDPITPGAWQGSHWSANF